MDDWEANTVAAEKDKNLTRKQKASRIPRLTGLYSDGCATWIGIRTEREVRRKSISCVIGPAPRISKLQALLPMLIDSLAPGWFPARTGLKLWAFATGLPWLGFES